VLGTLRLPLFLVLSGSPAAAAGTNIAISTAAAATGGWRHAREGRVDWRVAAWMTPPSVAGAVAGAFLSDRIPERLLFALVAIVLAWNGIDLIVRPVRGRPRERPRLMPAVVLGALIGLVGGAIGVILGTLRLPALLAAVGLRAHTAVGTNLVVGFFLGLAGFAAHAAQLQVEWGLLAAGLAGGVPGAWLGAHATGRLSEETLRRAIGAALLAVAAAFAIEAAL
jgi:uncharacterized protein